LAALWDIQAFGPKAAAAASRLTEMLKAGDDDLRTHAADALGAVGPAAEAAIPALVEAAAQDFDPPLRKAAAGALGAIGRLPEPALVGLMDLLKAEDASYRITAAWALGRCGAEAGQAAGVVAVMLQDGNCLVAEEAAYALGAIGGVAATAVPALLQALRRGEGGLPAGAAYALGCMGAAAIDKVVPALRKALRHMDPVVAEEAADALRRLGFGEAENGGASGLPACGSRGAAIHQVDPRFRTQ
jgi:HEAT repeat protein